MQVSSMPGYEVFPLARKWGILVKSDPNVSSLPPSIERYQANLVNEIKPFRTHRMSNHQYAFLNNVQLILLVLALGWDTFIPVNCRMFMSKCVYDRSSGSGLFLYYSVAEHTIKM